MTKYTVKHTTQFKKDYKLALRQHRQIELLDEIIKKLAKGEVLPPQNKDHPLSGNWINHRECHIEPDWLLIYHIDKDILVLTLTRTGTHNNLFQK